jgi:hypothetical protein
MSSFLALFNNELISRELTWFYVIQYEVINFWHSCEHWMLLYYIEEKVLCNENLEAGRKF